MCIFRANMELNQTTFKNRIIFTLMVTFLVPSAFAQSNLSYQVPADQTGIEPFKDRLMNSLRELQKIPALKRYGFVTAAYVLGYLLQIRVSQDTFLEAEKFVEDGLTLKGKLPSIDPRIWQELESKLPKMRIPELAKLMRSTVQKVPEGITNILLEKNPPEILKAADATLFRPSF